MSRIHPCLPRREKGLALLILLALLGITAAVLIIRISASAADTTNQDRSTARALGLAREALIARAANDLNSPGSLPCPDLVTNIVGSNVPNDGIADLLTGPACPSYIGRLPWKTLGLPDLRDGYGERLWYVLSPNFRDNLAFAPINSDTAGQLTVTGITPANNVIAIIFSPGPAIGTEQRDAANENNVGNYLEGSNAAGIPPGPPNNFNFDALQPSGTFNDRFLAITSDMLFPEVERRVAREARKCLEAFSQQPLANNRYPWAAPLTDLVNFADAPNTHSGRIPRILSNTQTSLDPAVTWVNPIPALSQPCFGPATWWDNWKELLFYHVSQAYEPSTAPTGTCPVDCLTVNGVGSVKVVVVVAGHAFNATPDQSTRAVNKTVATNYLEVDPSSGVDNSLMNGAYAKAPLTLAPTAHFNDRVECWHETAGAWPC